MKEIKIKLSTEDYEILKQIDFSEIEDEVFFEDKTREFRTTSDIVDIIFSEYIATDGMDENDCPTEYGRKLYNLYDLIFFSEEV